jgi:hypothetical protein
MGIQNPYENYYIAQAQNRIQRGGELPSFGGSRYQKGHGLGAIFARIRAALPWFFKRIGSNVLKTAVNVGQDVMSGRKLGDVIGSRLIEGVKDTARDVGPRIIEGIKSSAKEMMPQSGSGRRRRKQHSSRTRGKVKSKRHKVTDIFA